MYSKYISVKELQNTHTVELLNKVCDMLMQNTTVQSQHWFIGVKAKIYKILQ